MILALDSWIVVAWLKDQPPGAERMAQLWRRAEAGQTQLIMSVVNVGEVFCLVAKLRGEDAARAVLKNLRSRPLQILPAPKSLVLHAATLKARHLVSCADAFAAATAIRNGAPLVTGDPKMKLLAAEGLRLEWVES
ncbi:MAG: PIN domain-containing protein [Bryobacteraceae bacterium]